MARATIVYTFADGDSVSASVDVQAGYPDQLAEGVVTCVKLFREAITIGLEVNTEDDDES